MNSLLVLAAATARELSCLRQRLRDERSGESSSCLLVQGNLGGTPVALLETGVGGKRLADRLEEAVERFDCGRILLIGICGGIDPALKTGQSVIPGWVSDLSGDLRIPVSPRAWPEIAGFQKDSQVMIGLGGDIVSASRMLSAEEKQRLHTLRPGACAVDLESLAFSRCCQGHGIPWAVLKTVADPAGMELLTAREMALLRLPGDHASDIAVSDRFPPFQQAVEKAIKNNTRTVLSLFGEAYQAPL